MHRHQYGTKYEPWSPTNLYENDSLLIPQAQPYIDFNYSIIEWVTNPYNKSGPVSKPNRVSFY